MINFNKICVFDFETDGSKPSVCNPVQLAAIMINPRTLNIIDGSEFSSDIRPPSFDDEDYRDIHMDTIEWHAKKRDCKVEDVLVRWNKAPQEKDVWDQFQEYLLQYHTRSQRKSKFSAPIAAGYNILRFDIPILERIANKHNDLDKEGELKIFHPRDKIDGMFLSFMWFEHMDEPKSYSFDALREFYGMSKEGAHDAVVDITQCAEHIIRFMKLHRNTVERVNKSTCPFKGAFKTKVKKKI